MLTSAFDRLDSSEFNNYVHDLDQHSPMENMKCDYPYESKFNRGKYHADDQQQEDNHPHSHFSYLHDFDLRVETDDSLTEPQLYNQEVEDAQDIEFHRDTKTDSSSDLLMVATDKAPSYEYCWTRKRERRTSQRPELIFPLHSTSHTSRHSRTLSQILLTMLIRAEYGKTKATMLRCLRNISIRRGNLSS